MRDGKHRSVTVAGRLARFVPLLLLMLLLPRGAARGEALIANTYNLTWDMTVDKTDAGAKETRKFKHSLESRYRGFLSPLVENEIQLKVEQEKNTDSPSVVRIYPIITLNYRGSYWNSGAKRSIEDSSEAGKAPKTTDSYFVEVFYRPPRKTMPDLKSKYTLENQREPEVTDTSKHEVRFSSEYKPRDWMDVKGEYNRSISTDRSDPINATRTEDENYNATFGVRHFLSQKLRFNSDYKVDVQRGATIDNTGANSQKESQGHTVKNVVAFRPTNSTSMDASYDVDLQQDILSSSSSGQHTLNTTAKAAIAQKIGRLIDLKGEYNRTINETRHSNDDTAKEEGTWTGEAKGKFSKMVDLSFKYSRKHLVELHPAKSSRAENTTVTRNANWTAELTPFWKGSASYDRTDTFLWAIPTQQEVLGSIDTKYGLRSTFDLKTITATLEPTYDITLRKDPVVGENTASRDLKVKAAWSALSTRTISLKLDHTYGRKVDSGHVAEGLNNIQRSDSSAVSIGWKDFLPGWTGSIDATRTATDTSGDDLPPDVTETFAVKADYKFNQLALSTGYTYDRNLLEEKDNKWTFDFKSGWTTERWDLTLTYNFRKTLSEVLDEGYTVTLAFKYAL